MPLTDAVKNRKPLNCPHNMSLYHLIKVQAEQNSEAIAIAAPGASLSIMVICIFSLTM